MSSLKARFKIGTKFNSSGKHPRECTVIDILATTNSIGVVVKIRYIASHDFLSQKVNDYDVCDVTIARGLINE